MLLVGGTRSIGKLAAGSAAKLASADELVVRLESARGAVRGGLDVLDGVRFAKLGAQRVKPGSVASVEAAMQQSGIVDAVLGPAYYKAQHQAGNWPFVPEYLPSDLDGMVHRLSGMGYSYRVETPTGYVRHKLGEAIKPGAKGARPLVDDARAMLRAIDDDLATKLREALRESGSVLA